MTEPEPEPEPVIVSDEKSHEYYMRKMKPFFNYIDGIEAKFYYEVPDYKLRWQTLNRNMISKNAHEDSIGKTQMVSWRAGVSKGIRGVMGKFGGGLGEVLIYFMDDGLILAGHHDIQDKPPDPPWNWQLDIDKKKMKWVYKDNKGSAEPIYPKRIIDGHWSPGPWDMNPSKEGDRKEGCSICLETSGKQGKWCTTICGHSFHKECLFRALEKKPACPLCRRDIQYMVDALTSNPPPAPPEVKWDIKWKLFIISLVINEYIYYASLVGDTEFIRYLGLGGVPAAAKGTDLNAVLSGTDQGEADPSQEWFNKTYFDGESEVGGVIRTPLLAAISEGQVEIVKLIINNLGVDPLKRINKSNAYGCGSETALSYAITNAKRNKAMIVDFLITKMINEGQPLEQAMMWNGRGPAHWEVPLERAFKTRDTDIITLLIEKGANLNLKFSSAHGNKYPLDVALEKNMEGIKDLLERNGATRTPPGWWERTVSRMGQCVSPAQCGPGPVLQTDETLEAEPEPEPETGRAAMKKFKKKTKKKKSKLHKSKKKSKKKKTKKRKTRRRRS